jgi:hypothetical protein
MQAAKGTDMRPIFWLAPMGFVLGVIAGCNGHRIQGDGYFEEGSQHVGEDCVEEEHCVAGATCFEETCVGEGVLRVSMAWDRRTDFDLHVMTPSGHEIYWEDPKHATGVIVCRKWDGPHVENVFFGEDAEPGTYRVWVENYNGRRSSDWYIEVSGPGEVDHDWDGSLPQEIGVTSDVFEFTYTP